MERNKDDKAFIVYNYTNDRWCSRPVIHLIWAKDIEEAQELTKDWKVDEAGVIKKQDIDIIPFEDFKDKINHLDREVDFD